MRQQIYMQIVDEIKSKILSGSYQYGEKLPNEIDLKDNYKVSKATLRKALKILTDEGYIYSINRKGSFVSTPQKNDFVLYFDESDISLGIDCSEIISIDWSNIEVNHIKELSRNKIALEVKSLYKSSDIPVAYDIKYIFYNQVITINKKEFEYEKIMDILNKQLLVYQIEKKLIISGCKATEDIASNLQVRINDYVVKVEHQYYDQYKKNIARFITFYRPSFVKLTAYTG